MKMAVALARRIGEHKVIDDPDILESFSGDESSCAPAMPDLAVRAEQADDVIATVEEAEKFLVPVTPRGGGTGKAGSAIPIYGGVVLDMLKMNRILDIDRADLTAIVEPGCITGSFQKAVEQDGLFYPPDPNSLEDCSLGGNIAHNAGGPRAFKYGVTREYVMGVDVVMMGGTCFSTGRRTIKSVAGYDLTGLFVGSEGCFGLVTEIEAQLLPVPESVRTLLGIFDTMEAAGHAVTAIISEGLLPAAVEIVDNATIRAVEASVYAAGLPQDAGAVLLIELDGPACELPEQIERIRHYAGEAGVRKLEVARDEAERNRFWLARKGAFGAMGVAV